MPESTFDPSTSTTESSSVPIPHPAADLAPPTFDAGNGRAATAPARRSADHPSREPFRAADRTLNLLLHAAERDIRIGLTISIEGLIVSGTLVGTVAYCRALADQFTADAGGTGMDEEFAEAFRELVDEAYGAAHGDRRHPIDREAYDQSVQFVHLADARYVNGSEILPHGRKGVLWRCRAVDVTGWSLGELLPR